MKILFYSTIAVLLVTLLLAIFFHHSQVNQVHLSDKINKLSKLSPVHTVKESSTSVYNSLGEILYKLESEEVTYSPEESISSVRKPVVTLYNNQALPRWRLHANQGDMIRDNIIYLRKDVRLDSLISDSIIKSIKTDSLSVNLNSQEVFSDSRVELFGYNFACVSMRINYNLREKIAELHNDVITKYVIYHEQ